MVDLEPGTMNMDHTKLEAAITPKTKAIVPVHYAGVACEMDHIMALANRHNLKVIEDAAHAPTARYKTQPLGSIGHLGCFSFHETKNFTAGGQGGALVINDSVYAARAEVIYENGTNRRAFFRGEVKNSYSWMDIGSNSVMCEIQAAYLWAQLSIAEEITARRLQMWERYDAALRPLSKTSDLEVPCFNSADCKHNAHMYFIKLRDLEQRTEFQKQMKEAGIQCSPHYVPLHHRPMFSQHGGRFVGTDKYTMKEADRLIRLPLYNTLTPEDQEKVIAEVKRFLKVQRNEV